MDKKIGKNITNPKKTFIPDWFFQYEAQLFELQMKKFELEEEINKVKDCIIEKIKEDKNIKKRITSDILSVSLVEERNSKIFNTEVFKKVFPKYYQQFLTKPLKRKAYLQVKILEKNKIKK